MIEKQPINPNTADVETLQTITGIGPALAERIIASRPHSEAEDLLQVTGISTTFLDKIRGQLVFQTDTQTLEYVEMEDDADGEEVEAEMPADTEDEDSAEADPSPEEDIEETAPAASDEAVSEEETADEETDGDETAEEEATQPEAEPVAATAPEQEATQPAKKEPRYITRAQAFWMSATAAFFAFVLSVALTLAVLSALNSGLRFASPDQVRVVQSDIVDLQGQIDTLDSDLAGIRTRMDNFEALGGRITTLETEVGTLQTELEGVSGEVESLSTEIGGLTESVDELDARTNRFQQFLDGLTELLIGTSQQEESK